MSSVTQAVSDLRKRVKELDVQISDARSQKKQLKAALRAMRAEGRSNHTAPRSRKKTRERRPRDLNAALVRQYLAEQPGAEFGVRQLSEALDMHESSVKLAVDGLVKAGVAVQGERKSTTGQMMKVWQYSPMQVSIGEGEPA